MAEPNGKKEGLMACISSFWSEYIKVDPDWVKQVRGYLITAATLTATMAYQSILSPPGGFWQDTKERKNRTLPAYSPSLDNNSPAYSPSSTSDNPNDEHTAGQATMASIDPFGFESYLILNSIVLAASLGTIMLAMTGLPMKNKFLTWSMVFTVYITLSCMGAAYLVAVSLVSPIQLPDGLLIGLLKGWISLWAFVMVLHSCHFLVWLGKWLMKAFRKCCKPTTNNNNEVGQP